MKPGRYRAFRSRLGVDAEPGGSGGIESQIATSYSTAFTTVSYLAFTVKNGRGPPFIPPAN